MSAPEGRERGCRCTRPEHGGEPCPGVAPPTHALCADCYDGPCLTPARQRAEVVRLLNPCAACGGVNGFHGRPCRVSADGALLSPVPPGNGSAHRDSQPVIPAKNEATR